MYVEKDSAESLLGKDAAVPPQGDRKVSKILKYLVLLAKIAIMGILLTSYVYRMITISHHKYLDGYGVYDLDSKGNVSVIVDIHSFSQSSQSVLYSGNHLYLLNTTSICYDRNGLSSKADKPLSYIWLKVKYNEQGDVKTQETDLFAGTAVVTAIGLALTFLVFIAKKYYKYKCINEKEKPSKTVRVLRAFVMLILPFTTSSLIVSITCMQTYHNCVSSSRDLFLSYDQLYIFAMAGIVIPIVLLIFEVLSICDNKHMPGVVGDGNYSFDAGVGKRFWLGVTGWCFTGDEKEDSLRKCHKWLFRVIFTIYLVLQGLLGLAISVYEEHVDMIMLFLYAAMEVVFILVECFDDFF